MSVSGGDPRELYDAALSLVAVMENGIYFGPAEGDRDPWPGGHTIADLRREQRHREVAALARLSRAVLVEGSAR